MPSQAQRIERSLRTLKQIEQAVAAAYPRNNLPLPTYGPVYQERVNNAVRIYCAELTDDGIRSSSSEV